MVPSDAKLPYDAPTILSRFVLEGFPDPVFVLDLEGNLLDRNRASHASEHADLLNLFRPSGADATLQGFIDELRARGRASTEIRRVRPGGTTGYALVHGQRVERCLLITTRDISHAEVLENELRELRRVEWIGLLTTRVIHDLNNLLTPILYASRDLSAQLESGSAGVALAGEIETAAQRAALLVRDVLAFSRPRAALLDLLNVNAVISNLRPLLQLLLGGDVELVLQLQSGPWLVRVDGAKLEHALLNLVANARSAMPYGGRLTISTANQKRSGVASETQLAQSVAISIRDTGMGMSEEVRSRAFEEFFTTRGRSGGTGLGLASVQRFVAESHGRISMESEVGLGTSVTLEFPRADA